MVLGVFVGWCSTSIVLGEGGLGSLPRGSMVGSSPDFNDSKLPEPAQSGRRIREEDKSQETLSLSLS